MIGRLENKAELSDSGQWESRDSDLAAFLNLKFPPSRYGVWAGRFGVAAVIDAAKHFGVTPSLNQVDTETPEGMVI